MQLVEIQKRVDRSQMVTQLQGGKGEDSLSPHIFFSCASFVSSKLTLSPAEMQRLFKIKLRRKKRLQAKLGTKRRKETNDNAVVALRLLRGKLT